jgi:hypothetical protein
MIADQLSFNAHRHLVERDSCDRESEQLGRINRKTFVSLTSPMKSSVKGERCLAVETTGWIKIVIFDCWQ